MLNLNYSVTRSDATVICITLTCTYTSYTEQSIRIRLEITATELNRFCRQKCMNYLLLFQLKEISAHFTMH